MRPRQMKMGMFLRPAGHHVAGWRHPDAQADAGWEFKHYKSLAQAAERALFDMLFLADTSGVPSDDLSNISQTAYVAWIEPFTTDGRLGLTDKPHRASLHCIDLV